MTGSKIMLGKVVSPEKDEITKYVAAQKDPKGYVIIALRESIFFQSKLPLSRK